MKRIVLGIMIFAVAFGLTNWISAGANRDPLSQSSEGLYLTDFNFSGCEVALISNESTGTSGLKTVTTDPVVLYDIIYSTTATGTSDLKHDSLTTIVLDVVDSSATPNSYFKASTRIDVATETVNASVYPFNQPVRLSHGFKYRIPCVGGGGTGYAGVLNKGATVYYYVLYRKQ